MKISLIYPIWKDEALVPMALADINSFFSKFAASVEVVLVFDPPYSKEIQTQIQEWIQRPSHFSGISITPIWNKKTQFRGGSLAQGLKAAHGDILIAGSIDLSTPLSEVFQLLKEFTDSDNSPVLVVGVRPLVGKKKHQLNPKNFLHSFVDRAVTHELSKQHPELMPSQSSASAPSVFAVKKEVVKTLLPYLERSKWYYIPNITRSAKAHGLLTKSVDVLTVDKAKSHFSVFRFV